MKNNVVINPYMLKLLHGSKSKLLSWELLSLTPWAFIFARILGGMQAKLR